MIDRLVARYGARNIAGAVFTAVICIVLIVLQSCQSASPGTEINGTVMSSGAISLAEVHGGTREYASLQLTDGRRVGALVLHGGPFKPGVEVVVLERKRLWGDSEFEVIGLRHLPVGDSQ
jgi:hypothetical protein